MVSAAVKLPYRAELWEHSADTDLAGSEVLAPKDNVGHGPRYLPCLDIFLSDLRTYPKALGRHHCFRSTR